jgi:inositol phosphorylceramide mannosyltransferase catalytic subunit
MMNHVLYDTAERYCLPGRLEQFRSDIARYEILMQYGGLYVDADFEPRRRVDQFMDGGAWLAWERQRILVSNAIFGSEPEHPFVTRLAMELTRHVSVMVKEYGRISTSRLSGPKYVTGQLQRAPRSIGVGLMHQKLFFPYSWNQLDRSEEPFPEAFAIHHWNNQRRIQGRERSVSA